MKANIENEINRIMAYNRLSVVGAMLDNITSMIFCIHDIMGSYEQMDEVNDDVDPYLCGICETVEMAANMLFEIDNALTLEDAAKNAGEQAKEIREYHKNDVNEVEKS